MCEPATLAVLVGSAATAGTATVAATAATAGLIGAGGVVSAGAMTGLTALSAGAGLVGQMQQASAMKDSNANQARNLMLSRANNANQVNLERSQASEAAGQKINANNMAQREAQATTVAQAGPSGLSVDNLLADIGRKGATYNQSITANLDRTNLSLDNQLENVNTATSSGFNNMKTPAPVDYLGTALKIGTAYSKPT